MHQFLNKCEYCTTKQFIKCFPPFEDTKVLALVPSVLEEVHTFFYRLHTLLLLFYCLTSTANLKASRSNIKIQEFHSVFSSAPASPDNAVSQIRNRLCDDRLLCADKIKVDDWRLICDLISSSRCILQSTNRITTSEWMKTYQYEQDTRYFMTTNRNSFSQIKNQLTSHHGEQTNKK